MVGGAVLAGRGAGAEEFLLEGGFLLGSGVLEPLLLNRFKIAGSAGKRPRIKKTLRLLRRLRSLIRAGRSRLCLLKELDVFGSAGRIGACSAFDFHILIL